MRDHTSSEKQRPEEGPRKKTRPSAPRAPRKAVGAQEPTSYRVCCWGPAGAQVFDLSHDAVTNQWVLDVAHDERDVD